MFLPSKVFPQLLKSNWWVQDRTAAAGAVQVSADQVSSTDIPLLRMQWLDAVIKASCQLSIGSNLDKVSKQAHEQPWRHERSPWTANICSSLISQIPGVRLLSRITDRQLAPYASTFLKWAFSSCPLRNVELRVERSKCCETFQFSPQIRTQTKWFLHSRWLFIYLRISPIFLHSLDNIHLFYFSGQVSARRVTTKT